MKQNYFIGLFLAGLFVVGGCSEKRDSAPRVEIFPTVRTRVSGLYFDRGDRIGLTILKGAEPYVRNFPMTYDGSVFTDPGLVWYDDSQQTATLTAYYPYMESGTPEEFSVAADQGAGCESSDLLGAVVADALPVSTPVGMLFYHLMSQLTIIVDNTTDTEVTEVVIGGFAATAVVDFSVPTASAKPGVQASEIRTFEAAAGTSYRAILVPQQGDLSVTVTTSDGKTRSKSVQQALLESGKRYDLSIRVSMAEIEVTLSGEISDWVDGGSLDTNDDTDAADDFYETGIPEGSETASLVYEGVTYPTVRIGDQVWMAANLRYEPAGRTLDTDFWAPQEGLESDPELGLLYNYATATNGASGDGGRVQGICPDGWHLPDTAELQALAESAERPDDFLKCAGFWIVASMNQRYGDSSTGYLMGSECPESGKCVCLLYTSGSEPSLTSVSVNYGISVRCVQD